MDFGFLFNNFFALTITGLVVGSIYALVALGYTMVYGVLQLINFAHSEVFMYGTFAVGWVVIALGGTDTTGTGAAVGMLLVALVAAMVVSGGIALLVERFAYRPLIKRNAPKLVTLISAIGASFVLSEAMGLRDKILKAIGVRGESVQPYVVRSRDDLAMPDVSDPVQLFSVGDYRVNSVDLIVIVSAIVMMVAVDQFIRRSKAGRGIRAVAQDPESAALMGVDSTRSVQLTFLIGGLMAGAAALLYMIYIESTKFDVGFLLGVKAFTAAVLGGIGNLRGALLGGLVLGVAENWGGALVGSQWQDVVAFVLLIVILLFRPTGILGESLGSSRA